MRVQKEFQVSLPARILVVDDERVLAQNVKSFLDRRFPEVRVANDGRRAMALMASFNPDVVVLDYELPGENGLEVYGAMLRRHTGPIGCVMITGYPLEQIAQRANTMGIHFLLNKPFRLSELQRMIDRSVEEIRVC